MPGSRMRRVLRGRIAAVCCQDFQKSLTEIRLFKKNKQQQKKNLYCLRVTSACLSCNLTEMLTYAAFHQEDP